MEANQSKGIQGVAMTDFGWVGNLLVLGAVAGLFSFSLLVVAGLMRLVRLAIERKWIQ
jgi:hypothetical protein